MLLDMAQGNWKGCGCNTKPKQVGDSVKIDTEQGENWQIPMACPTCGTRNRLNMMILDGESLKQKYKMWQQGKLPKPAVNGQQSIPKSIIH